MKYFIISCLGDFLVIYRCETDHSKALWLNVIYYSCTCDPVGQELRQDSRLSSALCHHPRVLAGMAGEAEN